MALSRRDVLTRSAVGTDTVIAVGELRDLGDLVAADRTGADTGEALAPTSDPAAILDLQPGFSCTVVSHAGDPLPAGGITPGRHHGTGAFRDQRGAVQLVQNHEIGGADPSPVLGDPSLTYDPKAKGGTTTLTLDRSLRRADEYVSLAGTWRNSGGGRTPWGTWLTCEQTEQVAGPTADKDHGFVFEVDPSCPSNNTNPMPLKGLGRFAHRAACVDPHRGDVLLTEDASDPNGLLYRYRPRDQHQSYGALRNGGFLQAMRCRQGVTHVPDLSLFSIPGTKLIVEWVPVPDPQAVRTSIRKQYSAGEVTRARTFAGAWWGSGSFIDADPDRRRREHVPGDRAHIVCAHARLADGSMQEHDGQVWGYDPDDETLTLEAHFPVDAPRASHGGASSITVAGSPFGGLLLSEARNGAPHLLTVDDEGTTSVLARNLLSTSALTGLTFVPDARVLFATIQDPGLTVAIRGPFRSPSRT
jgi:hypothetical protein